MSMVMASDNCAVGHTFEANGGRPGEMLALVRLFSSVKLEPQVVNDLQSHLFPQPTPKLRFMAALHYIKEALG